MKTLFSIIMFFLVSVKLFAQGEILRISEKGMLKGFTKIFSTSYENKKILYKTTDIKGNIYLLSEFEDSIIIQGKKYKPSNPGMPEAVMLKFNPEGEIVFHQVFTENNHGAGYIAMAVDKNENIYYTGWYDNVTISKTYLSGAGTFLRKVDAHGNTILVKSLLNYITSADNIALDGNNAIYISSQHLAWDSFTVNGLKYTPSGIENTMITKFDKDGNYIRKKEICSFNTDLTRPGYGQITGVLAGSIDDGIFIKGYYNDAAKIDTFNFPIINATIDSSVLKTKGKDFAMYRDIYVARFDTSLQVQWVKYTESRYKDTVFAIPGNILQDVITDVSGNVYLSSSFNLPYVFKKVVYNNFVINYYGIDSSKIIDKGKGNKSFIAKIKGDGTTLWVRGLDCNSYSLTASKDGNLFLTSSFQGDSVIIEGKKYFGGVQKKLFGYTILNELGYIKGIKFMNTTEIPTDFYLLFPMVDDKMNLLLTMSGSVTISGMQYSLNSDKLYSVKFELGKLITGFLYLDIDSNKKYESKIDIPFKNFPVYINYPNSGNNLKQIVSTDERGIYSAYTDTGVLDISPGKTSTIEKFVPANYHLQLHEKTVGKDSIDFTMKGPPHPSSLDTSKIFYDVGIYHTYHGHRRVGGYIEVKIHVFGYSNNFVPATIVYKAPKDCKIKGGKDSFIMKVNVAPAAYYGGNSFSTQLYIGDSIKDLTYARGYSYIYTSKKDSILNNNKDSNGFIVRRSEDPNFKEVYPPEEVVYSIPDKFKYTVHFQNTGHAPAYAVYIKDTLDTKLDLETFYMLGASHKYKYEIRNRVLTVSYPGIILPDSNADEPNSHGYFSYTIQPYKSWNKGEKISNFADIFFDINPPVRTNTVVKWYQLKVDIDENNFSQSSDIKLYPNPANTSFMLETKNFQPSSVVYIILTDILGKQVKYYKELPDNNGILKKDVDVYDLPQGMYFIQVKQGNRIANSKMIIK